MFERSGQDRQRSLMRDVGLTDEEISWRKKFLQFEDEDVKRLLELNPLAKEYAESITEDFYRHLLSFEETAALVRDPAVLEYVEQKQKEYFLSLTEGDYGAAYTENRVISIGKVFERTEFPVKLYLSAQAFYLQAVMDRLLATHEDNLEEAFNRFGALIKLIFIHISLALDAHIFQREQTIGKQQEAIRELSTPVLQVREGLLILPIVGLIDTFRARQLTESLLEAISGNRAQVVVIDITGVPAVDSRVANNIVQTVYASRLMGASVILTGLSPEIAQTLVTLGIDLTMINTVGDLQGGIEQAERLLGYRVIKEEEPFTLDERGE